MTQALSDFDKFDASWERTKELTGWSQKRQLAEFLDIKGQSVSGARTRNSFPVDWAYRIASEFGGSTDWILEGKGPMRPGHPAGETQAPVAAKAIASPEDAFDALGMAEGMGLLAEIYSSKDQIYIRAINANLLAFADAVKTKAKAVVLEQTIQQMQVQMVKMQEQINELKHEVLHLRNENSDLKRELRSRGGNCEPSTATG